MPYVNVPKPTGANYTNVAKPSGGGTYMAGMTMGLLIPLTKAISRIVPSAYTNVSKPAGSNYTIVQKPT